MATILIVDDEPINRALVATLAKYAGHQTLEADNGFSGLELVRSARPDLVVCDLMMPVMDGYEFVRQLRAQESTLATKVIFYTATYLEKEARTLAAACGVRQLLFKPCEPEVILQTIAQALQQEAAPSPMQDGAEFDRGHLRLLSDKLALKIAQLEAANARLATLTELNLELASEHDPGVLLAKLCQGAFKLLGARFAVLAVCDPPEASPQLLTAGLSQAQIDHLRPLDIKTGLAGQVYASGKACRYRSAALPPGQAVLVCGDLPLHSGVVVALQSLRQVYGWLLVEVAPGEQDLSNEDERMLSIYAAQAGRIFETSSLYLAMQQSAESLRAEITERQRAAERLHESELRFRQIADNIREVFFLLDPQGEHCYYVSRAYEDIFGLSCDSLYAQPKSWLQAVHAQDRERVQAANVGGQEYELEYRILRPDGSERFIRARGFPIRDAAGQVFRVASVAEDVTEQVQLRVELRQREAGLRRAQSLARLAHLVSRPDGSFESWSDSLPGLLGLPADQVPCRSQAWLGRVHPEDRERFRRVCSKAAKAVVAATVDYRLQSGGGEWIYLHQEIEPLRERADVAQRCLWFNTIQDVSAQKLAEQKIHKLNRVYGMLSSINSLIVRASSREQLLRESCQVAVEVGGYTLAWIGGLEPGASDGTVQAWYGDNGDYVRGIRMTTADNSPDSDRPASQCLRSQKPFVSNDVLAEPALADLVGPIQARGLRSQACFPLLIGQRAVGVLTLCSTELNAFDEQETRLLLELSGNISYALDHIEKGERLNYLAYFDELTGLPNNALLTERLEQAIAVCLAEQRLLALVLIDLEHFKEVNQACGRQGGDALLRQLADRLRATPENRLQVARVSADRFALIMRDVGSAAEVGRLMTDQYRQWFDAPFDIREQRLQVAARLGIALFPADGADAETLNRNAESALKKAKNSSERVLFFDARMAQAVSERLALEAKLRLALEREEFVLYYQSKVDVDTRRIEGVEALIRWNSPDLGLVPPVRFIALLEETGLIVQVGLWALRQAASDHARWRARGWVAPRIAVNLSAVQLREPDFVSQVTAVLAGQPAPQGIDIELTESLLMEDIEGNIEKLQALRKDGVRLSIDDFGTGYSSLAYLSKLPAEILKIDRTFILTMLDDPNNMTLVSTMISLAHSLRMKVVAEGVETEDQAKLLRLLRCDQMQGNLVGQPLPWDALGLETL
jgi:diguanylate cyclase (GGDEF)-like protein/PAS domain S-box-containing protein